MDTNGDETSPAQSHPPPRLQSAPSSQCRSSPALREDCWSEDSTHSLIEAWGSRHLALNRGNLRQQHWQEVAAAVNSAAGDRPKLRRTDVQCKNRIDTLKKKYKIEKAKTVDSSGDYVSPWRFFSRLDFLISGGDSPSTPSPTPAPAPGLTNFPVGRRSSKPKRPAIVDESFFRRNFAVVAAAAASSDGGESSRGTSSGGGGPRRHRRNGYRNNCRELADAMMKFGEVYERVEAMKQEQLIELEKHRMQFAKDLEFQRMKLLMDTQLQLARIKRSKLSDDAVLTGSVFEIFWSVTGLGRILFLD